MTIDQRQFRDALGRFATGVAIVAATVDGKRLGATISSFNSVSLDPPLVLFSLAKNCLGFEAWKKADAFCIAILGEDQQALSNRFAKAGVDKWSGLEECWAGNGAPKVPGATAYFECEPYHSCQGGDHEVFICRVTDFHVDDARRPSLVFFGGRYRQLSPIESQAAVTAG